MAIDITEGKRTEELQRAKEAGEEVKWAKSAFFGDREPRIADGTKEPRDNKFLIF